MPKGQSSRFGEVDFRETDVIRFERGLPAFEDQREFVVIEPPSFAPAVFLQSLASPDLCFLTVPVRAVDPSYKLEVAAEDLADLGLAPDQQPVDGVEVIALAILAVARNGQTTANLLAPVLIHPKTRAAVQAVRLDSTYSHQHPLPGPLEEAPCL